MLQHGHEQEVARRHAVPGDSPCDCAVAQCVRPRAERVTLAIRVPRSSCRAILLGEVNEARSF